MGQAHCALRVETDALNNSINGGWGGGGGGGGVEVGAPLVAAMKKTNTIYDATSFNEHHMYADIFSEMQPYII